MLRALFLAAALAGTGPAPQRAVIADPPVDTAHPAEMEVLHLPTGGVEVNGLAYLPAGAGPHPILLLLHGLPGNEKNLDLAQAARRAGWVAVTFNYRGSWGSPGRFAFANVLEDVRNVLAWLRVPANARRLRADPGRIVLAGHSMGGWATLHTAAQDPALLGAIVISPGDIGALGTLPRDRAVATMADNSESLATTPAAMADEAIAHAPEWRFARAAPGLAHARLLVLTSKDGLAPSATALVADLRGRGNRSVITRHARTDHAWPDQRIALANAIVGWLERLAPPPGR